MIEIAVCVDCYVAHHYGWWEHEGEFFAGESDQPTDREPWGRLSEGEHEYDGTCSNHYYDQDPSDDECDGCGRPFEDGSGITEFSSSSCGGCGSILSGRRYRMMVEYR